MTTAEKKAPAYDAWQAPHLRAQEADLQAQEADREAPEAGLQAPEAGKEDLSAQVADLQAEEDRLNAQTGGTVDQLSDEEKLALAIAPQGFNRPESAPEAAKPATEKSDMASALSDEEEPAVSDMVQEASPFVRELIGALKTVYDPEIPVDIFELGLIYRIDVDDNKNVTIDMTLTAPGCPVAGEMPIMVENAIKSVVGVGEVDINMVFDPPWSPEKMSEEAQLSLNMF